MIADNGVAFTNNNGQTFALNNANWPLKEFLVESNMRANRIDRMQEPGEWPTRTLTGALLIHCGGDLLADTAADYITRRMNALQILVPATGVIDNQRKMGTLTISYTGFEPMYGDCALDDYPQLPMRANYPTVTEFTMTFRVFQGYMIGRNTGRFYSL